MRRELGEFTGIQFRSANLFQDNRGTLLKVNLEKNFHVDSVLVSDNLKAGTVRGLHIQTDPHGELKLVKCTAGKILDVILDVRPSSPTFGDWCEIILDSDTPHYILIPQGFAHGFQSLVEKSTVMYCISGEFNSDHSAVLGFSEIGIQFPLPISEISSRDQKGISLKEFLQIGKL
jgi:dTDP-4-dehydrorhamnose 3,5-epimerase